MFNLEIGSKPSVQLPQSVNNCVACRLLVLYQFHSLPIGFRALHAFADSHYGDVDFLFQQNLKLPKEPNQEATFPDLNPIYSL